MSEQLRLFQSIDGHGRSLKQRISRVLAGLSRGRRPASVGDDPSERVEPTHSAADARDPALIHLDQEGRLRSAYVPMGGEGFVLGAGDVLLDRLHIADRVTYMRALSAVRSAGAAPTAIDIRINRAAPASVQDFVATRMIMMAGRGAGEVSIAIALPGSAATLDKADADKDSDRLTIVSHELRTPLNAILGFTELLRGDATAMLPEARKDEYVDLIHETASHLLSVVNTMLDVSKIGAGRYPISRESFDLASTIDDAATMLAPRARQKAIHTNLHLEGITVPAVADRRAVKQIVINLLSNAIKFTPEQGCVTIEATTAAAGLVLTVSDTGIGIADEDIEQIGKPFHQVDNAYTRQCEGTGLGLYLVKGLADLHGGDIAIRSEPSIGTQVTVCLPAAERQSGAEAVTRLPIGTPVEAIERDEENAHASRRFG